MKSDFGFKNVVVIIFCLIVMAPNVIIFINRSQALNNGLEATALVTDFNSGTRGIYPRAYITYLVDGKKYQKYLLVKINRVRPGDEITILYNKDNPQKITLKNRKDAADNTIELILYSALAILCLILHVFIGCRNLIKTNLNAAGQTKEV